MNGLIGVERWTVSYGGLVYALAAPVFTPGTKIEVSVPVTSYSSVSVRTRVKVIIFEGSFLPGHGTKLAEYTSSEYTLSPNASYTFTVNHTTVAGTIDRRDVGVEVHYWDGSKWVTGKTAEFDDVYFVRSPEYKFEIGQPTVKAA